MRWGKGLTFVAIAAATSLITATVMVVTAGPAAAAVEPACGLARKLPMAQGADHSVMLRPDGTVWASGVNWAGMLGDGTTTQRTSPVKVLGLSDVVAVYAEGSHSMAMKSDGTLWAWGYNFSGELGDGTFTTRKTPVQVTGLPDDVAQVAAGGDHNLALTDSGTVWAWGRNTWGQLGNGGTQDSPVPVQVAGLTGIAAIAAGGYASYAVTSSGSVYAWGDGNYGALGLGDENERHTPTLVPGISTATAVTAGYDVAHARLSSGAVKGWGQNFYGQVGDGGPRDWRLSPVTVGNLTGANQVASGGNHTMALRSDGTVWAWGNNHSGQLGDGTTTDRDLPVQVSGLSGVKGIEGGANWLSSAVAGDGKVYAWGDNGYGQIGNGTLVSRLTPFERVDVRQVAPPAPTGLDAVAGEELALLNWTEVPNKVTTRYAVTPYINGVAQPDVSAKPGDSFAAKNLVKGVTYSFTVAGQNCAGTGTATTTSNRVVPTGIQLNEDGFKIENHRLTDRLALRVNTFNGNLNIAAADINLAGTGVDFALARVWSSRSTASSIFGGRWAASIGDVKLTFLANGSVFYNSAGAELGFAKNDDGTYTAPADLNATLTFSNNGTPAVTTDDTYTVSENGSGRREVFDATSGKLTKRQDRNGNTITFAYGGAGGALSSITDTHGRVITITYASGLVSTVSTSGRTWRYFYTGTNLTRYRDPANGDTLFAYDGSGNLNRITTPAGRVVAITYDGLKRVTTLQWALAPGTPTTTFQYFGDRTTVKDARNNVTTYNYDDAGRTTDTTDPLGNKTSLEYTSQSNVRRHSEGGAATTFGYTSAHALSSITAPTGANVVATYGDPANPHLPTEVRDPQGNTLTYDYDGAGNLLTQQAGGLPLGTPPVSLTYGTKGRVTTSTDMRNKVTSYGYDALGRLTSLTPPAPLGAVGPITYDAQSRVATTRDGKGQTTTFAYDTLDRVIGTTFHDGSTADRGYDGDGNLTSVTDIAGTTTMTYDAVGRLETRTTPDGLLTTYTYDAANNLTKIIDASGTTQYWYNAANLPYQMRTPDNRTSTMNYDARYNLTSIQHQNNVLITYTYDTSNRVTRVFASAATTSLVDVAYSYANPATGNTDSGLKFSRTDAVAAEKTTYTYDSLNRLTTARRDTLAGAPIETRRYTYDAMGNRKTTVLDVPDPVPDTSDTYTYNSANQLTKLNNEDFTYDANGNLVGSSLGAELTYDTADRTLSIRPRPDRGVREEYLYSGGKQTDRTASGAVARQLVTPPVCGLSCVDPADTALATTTFGDNVLGINRETTAGQSTYVDRDPSGRLISQRTSLGAQYLISDAMGSVVAVLDTQGGSLSRYEYDPFGQTIETSGVADITRWRFSGAYLDRTGLYKMGARYYDPAIGRWTQQDPVFNPVDPQLWNRYVYAGNDPINYVDPDGFNAVSDWFTKSVPSFIGKCASGLKKTLFPTAIGGALFYSGWEIAHAAMLSGALGAVTAAEHAAFAMISGAVGVGIIAGVVAVGCIAGHRD